MPTPATPEDVAAALAAKLAEAYGAAAEVEWAFEASEDFKALGGRKVWVVPDGYGDVRNDRGRVTTGLRCVLVVVEKYDGPASPLPGFRVPREWVAERTAWVRAQVHDRMSRAEDPAGWLIDDTCWPASVETTVYVELPTLIADKVFWSEVAVEYRQMTVK